MDAQNPFRTAENHDCDHEDAQEVVAERAIADAGQSQAMYNYNQKLLEQKERELMESIAMNYGRIREVERELGNLQLQLKLTSGPKKHALELLRKKIETQNEKVAHVRAKHTAAKATYERLDAELKVEEAAKERLCGELNTLVQQAARAQLDKLEELKRTLEGLYSGILPQHGAPAQDSQGPAAAGSAGPSGSSAAGAATQQQQLQAGAGAGAGTSEGPQAASSLSSSSGQPTSAGTQGDAAGAAAAAAAERQEQERQEQERRAAEERRRREAEAAAARSRHVSLGSPGGGASAGTRSTASSAVAASTGAGPTGRQLGSGAGGQGGAAGPRSKAPNGTAAAAGAAGAAAAPAGSAQPHRFAGFDT